MLTTTNYNFKKPELTDSPPDITVLNGNFDIIDEKLFAVIQAWEDFKVNGGNIGGDIKVRQKVHSSTLFLELLTSGGFGITIDENGSRIVPKVNKAIDIGSDAYRFKDLWLGDYSITNNGYNRLPNGMLLQMGTATIAGANGQTVSFPLQFESTIFKVIATVASNNKGTTPVHVWVTGKNQSNFYVRTSEASTIIDWFAIGK